MRPNMTDDARSLRILLADDHVTVRQGLKMLIESQDDMVVVSEASDGRAAVEQARTLRPDVVVMDISMPGMNGLVATRTLKEIQPDAVIVILTRHGDDAYLQELLRAGADGYVLKQSAASELLQAIRATAARGQYLDSALTARVTAGFLAKSGRKAHATGVSLSEREGEVLRLIAAGYSNKEIAAQLVLSVKTVEVHKANAARKLGLKGRIDIVKYALLQGWLSDT
jgi:two-component system, NarL family, response regulator NreC